MNEYLKLPWPKMFAEFIVIASGVVFGLLADEWRQDLSDRERERQVLVEILMDLEVDSAELAALADRNDMWDQAGLWAYRHKGQVIPDDSAASALRPLFFYREYFPSSTAFMGLRDSGELTLIKDTSLRRAIVTYFGEHQPDLKETYDRFLQQAYYGNVESRLQIMDFDLPKDAVTTRDRLELSLVRPWHQISEDRSVITSLVQGQAVWGSTLNLLSVVPLQEENQSLKVQISNFVGSEAVEDLLK
tara:strand:+ start:60 stop:797 length:738 start_codon:yes stop_codon:yes gene_type:complete